MNTKITGLSKRVPGILYLILAITGFYAKFSMDYFTIISSSAQWFELILENRILYISGILSFYLMNLSWILLAFFLYNSFKENNKRLSVLLLLSVISGSVLVFVAIIMNSFPLYVMHLLTRIPELDHTLWIENTYRLFFFGREANMATFLFYSIWLFPFAACILRQKSIARIGRTILFIALCLAGIGYFADFIWFHIFPFQDRIHITGYTFWGEVVILFWLLIKGLETQVYTSEK